MSLAASCCSLHCFSLVCCWLCPHLRSTRPIAACRPLLPTAGSVPLALLPYSHTPLAGCRLLLSVHCRQCAAGLQAVIDVAASIREGYSKIGIAGEQICLDAMLFCCCAAVLSVLSAASRQHTSASNTDTTAAAQRRQQQTAAACRLLCCLLLCCLCCWHWSAWTCSPIAVAPLLLPIPGIALLLQRGAGPAYCCPGFAG